MEIRFNTIKLNGHIGLYITFRDIAGADTPLFVQKVFALTEAQQADPDVLMGYAVASLNDIFDQARTHIEISGKKKDPLA